MMAPIVVGSRYTSSWTVRPCERVRRHIRRQWPRKSAKKAMAGVRVEVEIRCGVGSIFVHDLDDCTSATMVEVPDASHG